jgi:serpin B
MYTAMNQFGLDLLKVSDKSGGNVAISPFSAHSALSLLANGSKDKSLDELLKLMRTGGGDMAALNNAHRALLDRQGDQLSSNNAVFLTNNLKPSPEFEKLVADNFHAEIKATSDSDPTVVNNWVKEKTKDRIPKLIEEFPANTVFLTVNATVFDGEWMTAFDEKRTQDHPFEKEDGTTGTIKLMSASESALRIPGDWVGGAMDFKGDKLRAVFIMPKRGEKVADLIARLTPDDIAGAAMAQGEPDQSIALPRFDIRHRQNLIAPFRAMGGGYLLAPNENDFSGLVPGSPKGEIWIGDALQETVVEFDEKGARGAAATAIIGVTKAALEDPLTFTRPFLWMIVDRQSGALLLTGTYRGPK